MKDTGISEGSNVVYIKVCFDVKPKNISLNHIFLLYFLPSFFQHLGFKRLHGQSLEAYYLRNFNE